MELSTVINMRSSFYINEQRLNQMCDEYGFCTKMSDEEYDAFLDTVIDEHGNGVELTDELRDSLVRIIYNYSDLDHFLTEENRTTGDFLADIIYILLNTCYLAIDLSDDYNREEL